MNRQYLFELAGADGKLIEPESDIGGYCPLYLACLLRQKWYGSLDAYWEQFLPPPAAAVSAPDADIPVVDTNEAINREKTHWSIWMEPASPRKAYGIQLVRALYAAMSDLAASKDARFLVFDVNRYTKEAMATLHRRCLHALADVVKLARG